MPDLYGFSMKAIDGADQRLGDYRGKVLLIVNVASECGLTPQYEALQKLHAEYAPRGFAVLGFPCNQFGGQEPGSNADVKKFCTTNYGVTFPLFSKIEVNGANTHPLYKYLKKEAKGLLGSESIKWNFTKFLVDKDGNVVRRYASTDTPQSMEKDVAATL